MSEVQIPPKLNQSKLLRWAGSKSQSANHIKPFLNFDSVYIEPFCGSASFFFSEKPKRAILNDSNRALISFYRQLRKSPNKLWNIYSTLEISKERYLELRQEFNTSPNNVRRAAIFLYLNHFCFNGLYRTNLAGEFNTPYNGSRKIKKKLDLNTTEKFGEILNAATLHSKDFEKFLRDIDPSGACIYMDPPYSTEDSRVFIEYGSKPFNLEDLNRLLDLAEYLSKRNLVVITHKECSEFHKLFGNHIQKSVPITRNVGGFAGRRKRDFELIAVLGKK